MQYFSPQTIGEMFNQKQNELLFKFDPYKYFVSIEGIQELLKLAQNPGHYLINNSYPFSISKKKKNRNGLKQKILCLKK